MESKDDNFIFKPGVIRPNSENENDMMFIFNKDKLLVKMHGDEALPLRNEIKWQNFNVLRSQYLGNLNGVNCYSVEITGEAAAPQGMGFRSLMSILGTVDENMFFLISKAFQVMDWDRSHQFCSRCGTPTSELKSERAKVCPKCGFLAYPRISPAIIAAILNGDKILLAHNNSFEENIYSLIAGYVEPGETLEHCVVREVEEEVGIKVKNIKYFSSQPWPFPYSIMVAFTAEYESGEITPDGFEITDAGWYRYDNLPFIPKKGSAARKLIDWYVEKFK